MSTIQTSCSSPFAFFHVRLRTDISTSPLLLGAFSPRRYTRRKSAVEQAPDRLLARYMLALLLHNPSVDSLDRMRQEREVQPYPVCWRPSRPSLFHDDYFLYDLLTHNFSYNIFNSVRKRETPCIN
jgi:hypothetical protein